MLMVRLEQMGVFHLPKCCRQSQCFRTNWLRSVREWLGQLPAHVLHVSIKMRSCAALQNIFVYLMSINRKLRAG